MFRDFRISELRAWLNSVTLSTLRKNFISDANTCDRTLSVITTTHAVPNVLIRTAMAKTLNENFTRHVFLNFKKVFDIVYHLASLIIKKLKQF